MDQLSMFVHRGFDKIFARRGSGNLVSDKDKAHNNRKHRPRKRNRSGRKRDICVNCPAFARTNLAGWAKQLCTKCARDFGCSFPQKHTKKDKVTQPSEVGCVKKEVVVLLKKKTKKREPEAEEDDARPSNVKVHPYIQLHEHYLIEKRERARCEAKKTKWKRQALRKGRACARLTAAVFKMNDELMKTKQRPAAEITTNDEDPSSNETGNDGPVSDKVDDDDFSMDKKLPKGVRICKGPVPMPRIPAREKCQGRKALASATHQVVPLQRVRLWHLPLQRTCLSPSGCGKVFCKKCYP